MNAKQLQYAIELSKTLSFSQVSEKLGITQPSLSKQILNLENDLGIKLFDRNTVPITLTPAGEYFIREAQALLYQEDQLRRSLEQFASGEKGRLTIGVSPFRNLCLMPEIVRRFREKFPGVQVSIQETASDQLRKEAAEGRFDFAIVNLPVDESLLEIIPLAPESLVLAVPTEMTQDLEFDRNLRTPTIDFAQCRDLPFVVVAQTQEMRRYFDALCARCDIKPEIAVEVTGGVTTAWSMACAGVGATLLPLQFADSHRFRQNLTLFTLTDANYTRQPVIVSRRGQYLSPYAQYAIRLITEMENEEA